MVNNTIEKVLSEFINSFESIKTIYPVYYSLLVVDYTAIADSLKSKFDDIPSDLLELEIRKSFLRNLDDKPKSFFTITSKDSFSDLPTNTIELGWGESLVYTPLNDHSRIHLKKGDVFFCYRQGQFENLNEALNTRGIYSIGIAASDPIELFPELEKHNKWGVLICFPLQFPFHLELRNIQLNPKTIDLTPYNGNRNDALQYISEERHYKTLLNMMLYKNEIIEDRIQYFFSELDLKAIKLPSIVYEEYYSKNETKINTNNNVIINEFITWFMLPENFKKSYDGLVTSRVLEFWSKTYFKDGLFKIEFNDASKNFSKIENLINEKENHEWKAYSDASSKGAPEAVLGKNNYLKFLNEFISDPDKLELLRKDEARTIQLPFEIKDFHQKLIDAGLIFSRQLIQRFIASLCTKPFVVCSGLSGSGKTKLAQAFAQWICYKEEIGQVNDQYLIVPVGADWTNREPLLGYPNALSKKEYVSPENGVLDLMIRAKINIENPEEPTKPFFLILDEMNLSHVERYFADFLSTMESGDKIPLHTIENDTLIVPPSIKLPKNLFIIGTVNIDETTYMFSPKVLDRANTIEFRLTEKDLADFMLSDKKLNMDLLKAQGANMAESFMDMALQETDKNLKAVDADLKLFFSELKKSGAEFGYRTASEIGRLMYMLTALGEAGDNLFDIAIMQKLLPKLHGSRNKLTKVLPILGSFCLTDNTKVKEDYLDKFVKNSLTEADLQSDVNIKYKISFEKICRMYKNAVENGFASYAEA